MTDTPDEDLPAPTQLGDISTHWSRVHEPARFAMRYAVAIRGFLARLVPDPHDADEVTQEFFAAAVRHGFARATPDRGRFRHYLFASLRNAARNYLARKSRHADRLARIPDEDPPSPPIDDPHLSEWRQCVIDRVMRRLHARERANPGNLFHTVLRIRAEFPDEASPALAARASSAAGRDLSPEAYRKQVSRAMTAFAWGIACEVADTVEPRTADAVEEELREIGLFHRIEGHLPADWRTRPLSDG